MLPAQLQNQLLTELSKLFIDGRVDTTIPSHQLYMFLFNLDFNKFDYKTYQRLELLVKNLEKNPVPLSKDIHQLAKKLLAECESLVNKSPKELPKEPPHELKNLIDIFSDAMERSDLAPVDDIDKLNPNHALFMFVIGTDFNKKIDYNKLTTLVKNFRDHSTAATEIKQLSKKILLAVGFKQLMGEEISSELKELLVLLPSNYFAISAQDRCVILLAMRTMPTFISTLSKLKEKAKDFLIKSINNSPTLFRHLRQTRYAGFLPTSLPVAQQSAADIIQAITARLMAQQKRQAARAFVMPVISDISATSLFNPSQNSDVDEVLAKYKCNITFSLIVGDVIQETGTSENDESRIYYCKEYIEGVKAKNGSQAVSPVTRRPFEKCGFFDATISYRENLLKDLSTYFQSTGISPKEAVEMINECAKALGWKELSIEGAPPFERKGSGSPTPP